jgi:hypothetical protein
VTYKVQTFLFSGVLPLLALLLRTFECVHAGIAASDAALAFDERVAPCTSMYPVPREAGAAIDDYADLAAECLRLLAIWSACAA